jgi:general stress protein 26
MTTDERTDRPIDELIGDRHTIAMFMTMVDGHHTSRPVTLAEVSHGRVSILARLDADWVRAIAANRAVVHLTVADDKRSTYVALNGDASVTTDQGERERLWTPFATAWFDGPNDPALGVVRFDVRDGEYWNGPNGAIGKAVRMIRAAVTGIDDSLGEQGNVAPR